MNRFNSFISNL